MVDVKSKLIL